ncbi:MAG: hypothetical protein AAGB31_12275 [Bdellovibrio sp.]
MSQRKYNEKMVLPFTAIPNILARGRFLTNVEKLVLFYIASMGPMGLTISTKVFRQELAPLGTTGLLRAIKRLVFLGMIRIEKVPKKQGDPPYKKPCYRYFFVKDPLEWQHTIDFRVKIKTEIERMEEKSAISFRHEVFLDDKSLNDAFEKWLISIKGKGFEEKPQTPAVSPYQESQKWIKKTERLKNGELTFLRIADDAISYSSYLENHAEGSLICREKSEYMMLIFDRYEDACQSPQDERTRKDIEWIQEMKQKGMLAEEISRELLRENTKRQKESANGGVSSVPIAES